MDMAEFDVDIVEWASEWDSDDEDNETDNENMKLEFEDSLKGFNEVPIFLSNFFSNELMAVAGGTSTGTSDFMFTEAMRVKLMKDVSGMIQVLQSKISGDLNERAQQREDSYSMDGGDDDVIATESLSLQRLVLKNLKELNATKEDSTLSKACLVKQFNDCLTKQLQEQKVQTEGEHQRRITVLEKREVKELTLKLTELQQQNETLRQKLVGDQSEKVLQKCHDLQVQNDRLKKKIEETMNVNVAQLEQRLQQQMLEMAAVQERQVEKAAVDAEARLEGEKKKAIEAIDAARIENRNKLKDLQDKMNKMRKQKKKTDATNAELQSTVKAHEKNDAERNGGGGDGDAVGAAAIESADAAAAAAAIENAAISAVKLQRCWKKHLVAKCPARLNLLMYTRKMGRIREISQQMFQLHQKEIEQLYSDVLKMSGTSNAATAGKMPEKIDEILCFLKNLIEKKIGNRIGQLATLKGSRQSRAGDWLGKLEKFDSYQNEAKDFISNISQNGTLQLGKLGRIAAGFRVMEFVYVEKDEDGDFIEMHVTKKISKFGLLLFSLTLFQY